MIGELLTNCVFVSGISAWLLCQLIKFVINGVRGHEWSIRHFLDGGSMPSSHSAAVVAATTAAGLREGFSSSLFAVSLIFACVVMYDAAGVRRETGKQGKIINEILDFFTLPNKDNETNELKEKVGHSPLEVLTGAIFGILCALILCRIM